jgi:microcystin degradation protein MlrC
MKNRIVVGSLRQETNSFSQVKTMSKDFAVYKGKEMLDHIAVTHVFREADVEIIPTLCAYAMPSGKVDEKTYIWRFLFGRWGHLSSKL